MDKTLPFKPLKKARYYEAVAEQIKETIFTGQLRPGDSLPSERELKDIERLEQQLEKIKDSGSDINIYFELAVEFHQQLALATGNKIYYLMWEMLHDILLKGYVPILSDLFPEGPSKLLEANILMLEAIKSRDPDRIDKAMEIHANEEKFFTSRNSANP